MDVYWAILAALYIYQRLMANLAGCLKVCMQWAVDQTIFYCLVKNLRLLYKTTVESCSILNMQHSDSTLK